MPSLLFTHPLYATLLENKNGEKNLIDNYQLPKESGIFKSLDDAISQQGGFDYFYYNDILIIPDVGVSKNSLNPIFECQIDGMKEIWIPYYKWVLFLSFESSSNDSVLIVHSLKLPSSETVRNNLQFRNRTELYLLKSNKEETEIYSKYSDIEKYIARDLTKQD